MPSIGQSGKPQSRRYAPDEKAVAVRMVMTLRAELGTKYGTVKRVAEQLGYGHETVRSWVRQAEIGMTSQSQSEGESPNPSSEAAGIVLSVVLDGRVCPSIGCRSVADCDLSATVAVGRPTSSQAMDGLLIHGSGRRGERV
jgi:transposase-like protein